MWIKFTRNRALLMLVNLLLNDHNVAFLLKYGIKNNIYFSFNLFFFSPLPHEGIHVVWDGSLFSNNNIFSQIWTEISYNSFVFVSFLKKQSKRGYVLISKALIKTGCIKSSAKELYNQILQYPAGFIPELLSKTTIVYKYFVFFAFVYSIPIWTKCFRNSIYELN
jgi:hypothetical protein